jgi:hypothetical protein
VSAVRDVQHDALLGQLHRLRGGAIPVIARRDLLGVGQMNVQLVASMRSARRFSSSPIRSSSRHSPGPCGRRAAGRSGLRQSATRVRFCVVKPYLPVHSQYRGTHRMLHLLETGACVQTLPNCGRRGLLKPVSRSAALRIKTGERCEPVRHAALSTREPVQERLVALRRMRSSLDSLIRACERREDTDDCPLPSALDLECAE